MKVLVTGGAGFIGSHTQDQLILSGYDVVVVDNLSTGFSKNINPKAKFYQTDIQDKTAIAEIFATERPDAVFHFAAQMDVRRSVADPFYDANVNIIGTLNLLENAVKNKVKRFIFVSTGGAVYGEQDFFPADENHPLNPLSPYGVGKLAVEKYLHFYKNTYGLNYFIVRYANVYGPRQNPFGEAGVVAIFCDKMLKKEQPFINGNGLQTRDYVYVKDVVAANLLAVESSVCDVVNIGTGIETNVVELFLELRKLVGSNCEELHKEQAQGEQLRSVIDNSKAGKILGWQPKYTLETGLAETVDFFKSITL